jgi:hypothetical protein
MEEVAPVTQINVIVTQGRLVVGGSRTREFEAGLTKLPAGGWSDLGQQCAFAAPVGAVTVDPSTHVSVMPTVKTYAPTGVPPSVLERRT